MRIFIFYTNIVPTYFIFSKCLRHQRRQSTIFLHFPTRYYVIEILSLKEGYYQNTEY